ncbi:MAG: CGGC domain-containing protein [Deltaproteobacteria bacterium]|nr:MAG: CGGC domain-containing protein [Deltaproteobacteria bacterium]
MKKAAIIGCGAYMESGYGCPGEWRCLKAAALGEGHFEEETHVVLFIRCECPGRATASTLGMAMKLSEIKPDVIYLSSCMVNARPACPYMNVEEFARTLEQNTGIPVVPGTHDYH